MDEIVKDFLIESNENLDRLDLELVRLESDPSSKELLSSIFRTIHTIKGTCSFLGFTKLEKLTHAGESLLARLRDGELRLSPEITSGLLAMVDAIRLMLTSIKETEQDGKEAYTLLMARLADLQNPAGPESKKPANPSAAPLQCSAPQRPADTANAEVGQHAPGLVVDDDMADPSKLGGFLLQRGLVTREDLALALHQQEVGRKRLGEILIAQGAARPEDVVAAQRALESRNPEAGMETIRVGLTLLDRLMNLVGELVLARNQLLQFRKREQDAAFLSLSQRLNLITGELQEEVMKTRMQPISNVWSKFPRTVRDLARNGGRDVRLEMEGQDTELDRTIIETIKDPMTHLVRNAIDHGIEPPDLRKKKGKPPAGLLKLRAFHEGGHVHIEVSDDGAGLNRQRIREKAMERGILSPQQAEYITDRDLFGVIFLPGFSTAETVTKISGRGVGMDVVKTKIEKSGGTVEAHSTADKGTTIKIKIPLTLAIIPALLVKAGGERFAIPQVSLLELVRLESTREIEMVQNVPVYRLRGRLLALISLRSELALSGDDFRQGSDSAVNIVVVRAHGREFGIVVDEIVDSEEIVVKPLSAQLKRITAYSGATIFGDGRVGLILDVVGLAQTAGINLECGERPQKPNTDSSEPRADSHPQALLVAECAGRRVAVPLSVVTRLEEFPVSSIEWAGPLEVTQYRGQVMPLIRLSQNVSGGACRRLQAVPECSLQVVVCAESERTVGLVVDRVIDVVDEELALDTPGQRAGVLGSSIIQNRVTELLDVPALLREGAFSPAGSPAAVQKGM